jgi:hypothetical protein
MPTTAVWHINYFSNGVRETKKKKRKGKNKGKSFFNCPFPLQLGNCHNDFFK